MIENMVATLIIMAMIFWLMDNIFEMSKGLYWLLAIGAFGWLVYMRGLEHAMTFFFFALSIYVVGYMLINVFSSNDVNNDDDSDDNNKRHGGFLE